jgi:hypothetical protein
MTFNGQRVKYSPAEILTIATILSMFISGTIFTYKTYQAAQNAWSLQHQTTQMHSMFWDNPTMTIRHPASIFRGDDLPTKIGQGTP